MLKPKIMNGIFIPTSPLPRKRGGDCFCGILLTFHSHFPDELAVIGPGFLHPHVAKSCNTDAEKEQCGRLGNRLLGIDIKSNGVEMEMAMGIKTHSELIVG